MDCYKKILWLPKQHPSYIQILKKFIKAEAVSCDDFIKYGSVEKCKENGKLRIEGKDYIVKDGDVLHFRINS